MSFFSGEKKLAESIDYIIENYAPQAVFVYSNLRHRADRGMISMQSAGRPLRDTLFPVCRFMPRGLSAARTLAVALPGMRYCAIWSERLNLK